MRIAEHVPLATLTTLAVGGPAAYVATCASEEDVRKALAFARDRVLPWAVLGEGSNVLAADGGFEGMLMLMRIKGIAYASGEDDRILVTAGAGVSWDALVTDTAARGLWGLENLSGIPGTVGAAPVQNIGAYGAEIGMTLAHVDAFDAVSGETVRFLNEECRFGYRDSRFKRESRHIILGVTFALSQDGVPSLGYKDLAALKEAGEALDTPVRIADAVRRVRARKFPDIRVHGTAGSFFKNPVITPEAYASLLARYPELPSFPAIDGVKVPLAYILDRMLGLRGYRDGKVWLFDAQPLVLVADRGATAQDIDAFADRIAARVHAEIGIAIEREVRSFPPDRV